MNGELNALQIIEQDRDVWKQRAISSEAENVQLRKKLAEASVITKTPGCECPPPVVLMPSAVGLGAFKSYSYFGPCADGRYHDLDTCPIAIKAKGDATWPCGQPK